MNLYIVTGGSKGMGRELTQYLVGEGHRVAVLARSCPEELAEMQGVTFVKSDLSQVENLSNLMSLALSHFSYDEYKSITLVNNAGGVLPIGKIENLKGDEIEKSMALNLIAPITLTSAFLSGLKSYSGERRVVNISSGVAKSPVGSWSVYSAAKAGLENFSNCLIKEYGESLSVINFGPGVIDTQMQATIREQNQIDFPDVERFKNFKEEGQLRTPLQVATVLAKILLGETTLNSSFVNVADFD